MRESEGEEEEQQHHQQPMMKSFRCETLEMPRELDRIWMRDEYDEAFKQAFINYPNRWDIIVSLFPSPWPPLYMKQFFENMKYDHFFTELASSHRTPSRSLSTSSMVKELTPPAVPVPIPVQVPSTMPKIQEHTPPVRISHKRFCWSEDEHRLFLEGINKYGKRDWISISKYLIPPKTPS
ncbi:hypothetical protein RIF29_20447 [Crotalaria pallida]|uniref:Uncharacterized protein n=1 Tax=Crotalaria pallida TaxID=3830 RepID=A0AAN9F9Q2_CROPI